MRAAILTEKRAKSLRRAMSLPEVILWTELRRRNLGVRFRRQHPFGAYILDFYCPSLKLAIEVDGAAHDDPQALRHDLARDAWLNRQGVQVLRYPAAAILNDEALEGGLEQIAAHAAAPTTAFGGPPPPLRG